MQWPPADGLNPDHCRIGSLEMPFDEGGIGLCDHCRIGSLEIEYVAKRLGHSDHCRIGSLENKQA